MPATPTTDHSRAYHEGGGVRGDGQGHEHDQHQSATNSAPLTPAVTTLLDLLIELAIAETERATDGDTDQGRRLNDVPGADP